MTAYEMRISDWSSDVCSSDLKQHWADRQERGSFWLMKLTAFAAKVLGRRLLSPLLYGIVLYFFIFGRRARQAAWQYQQRLADWRGRSELRPSHWRVFGQFIAFPHSLPDKPHVLHGQLPPEHNANFHPPVPRNHPPP